MEWMDFSGKWAHLMCQLCSLACTRTHARTHIIHSTCGKSRVKWFSMCSMKSPDASLNFLMCSFYLHTECCLSQLLLSGLSIWMSTLLLQQVMQQQVSLCLSVSYPLSVFVPLSQPLLLSFPQFCLTAIITCLPNGILLQSTFSTLCKHLYFFRLDILPLSPSHSDCNGWNRESSLLLSCLFSYCLQPKPWQCCFWLAWGKWTLWHFTPWIVAAHGFSSKHCSLLPWQLMTKFQPPCTYLCQDFTQTGLSQNVQRDQSREALFFFYFPILFSSVSLSLLSTM